MKTNGRALPVEQRVERARLSRSDVELTPEMVLGYPERLGRAFVFDWGKLVAAERRRLLESLPGREFTTSGSTGEPKTWYRSGRQLREEVCATLVALPSDIDRVISAVPSETLYGYVFSVLIPAELGVPVTYRLGRIAAQVPVDAHALVVTMPMTWRHVPPAANFNGGGQVTFVHAGAVLPPSALRYVDSLPRARLIELYGATETGLIGWRKGDAPFSDALWAVADDVRLFPREDGPEQERVAIMSPRLGARVGSEETGAQYLLDDQIKVVGRGHFQLVARGLICKPDGKKVHLGDIEDRLWPVLKAAVVDLRCVAVTDDKRAEHVALHVVLRPGVTATDVARKVRVEQAVLPVVPAVVAVEEIKRSAMGKPALRSKEAQVSSRRKSG